MDNNIVSCTFPLTEEQEAIIDAAGALDPGQSLRVIAFAGAGKTTTLKAVARESGLGNGVYVAFNKAIATDAKRSFPPSVDCRTLHSIAWRALSIRMDDIDNRALSGPTIYQMGRNVPWLSKACGLRETAQARLAGRVVSLFCQSADQTLGEQHVEAILNTYVYKPPAEHVIKAQPKLFQPHLERRQAIGDLIGRVAQAVWSRLREWRKVPGIKINHDVYLKLFELDNGLVQETLGGFDFIMLDEAQDLNPVMRSAASKAETRLIAVGDRNQQIYSWRGSEDALEQLPGECLYLSQSFRFGESIAEAARRVLYDKPTGGPEVRLRGSDRSSKVVEEQPSRVTLCRTNAGLLTSAIGAAKAGKHPHVVGGVRELAEEVREALLLYQGKQQELPETSLYRRFEKWAEFKEEAEQLDDPSATRLIEMVESGLAKDLDLLDRVHVASEDAADAVFSTAHRAKGREWPMVALNDDFPDLDRLERRYDACVDRGEAPDIQAALEEWNVLYVAVTRAIDTLSLPRGLAKQLR